MSFDVKCHELARAFLAEGGWTHDQDVAKLAQAIQDLIEEFIAELEETP